ncbi:MAG TPA: hypothetical protein VK832_21395 [Burkholderiaceae bacterium]|jgi:hypothetical protein|nr:hypothetical protein [Burkholderiaceae bacterium]
MYIVAIGWIYVVLMMSITETSVTAGVMTFFLYGILPLGVILYLLGTPERKRRRQAAEKKQNTDAPSEDASNQAGPIPVRQLQDFP